MTVTSIRSCILVILVLTFAIRPIPVAAVETIRNISATPHGAPAGTSLAEIAGAIKQAAHDRRWEIIEESPGSMTASILVRGRHLAMVSIGYDSSSYWIDYKESTNLDYSADDKKVSSAGKRRRTIKGPVIHGAYNRWVNNLSSRIAVLARVPPDVVVPDVLPSEPPFLIADELEKLDALRKRGILTQEEFDLQKAKLLAH